MTPKRTAEVNRRLAEFDGWGTDELRQNYGYHGDQSRRRWGIPDYTADLNALARLEGKLPAHAWEIEWDGHGHVDVACEAVLTPEIGYKGYWSVGVEPTEAEARAEAIYQYLERRKEERK